MYAVISSGGKQYRLTEGDLIEVERLSGNPGDQVVFEQVLYLSDDQNQVVGTPTVEGARVVGEIVDQGRGDKVVVFKFKRRKMYRRKSGHRQFVTRVRIESIQSTSGLAKESKATAQKEEETQLQVEKKAKGQAHDEKAKPESSPKRKLSSDVAKKKSSKSAE